MTNSRKPTGGSGRPARPVVTLPASAEEIAQRFFENAKPPQPDSDSDREKPKND